VSEFFISAFIRIYPHNADCPHPHLHVSAIFPQFCSCFGNASSQANRQPATMMSTGGRSVCSYTSGRTGQVSGRGGRGPHLNNKTSQSNLLQKRFYFTLYFTLDPTMYIVVYLLLIVIYLPTLFELLRRYEMMIR
jgi:hypothetical protein